MATEEHDESEAVVEVSELESMRGGRPSTDANVFVQLIVGVVGTLGLAYGLRFFDGGGNASLQYLNDIVNKRGWVQYAELIMALMVMALLILKARIVKNQLKVLASNPVPPDIDLSDDEQLHNLRDSIIRRDEFAWSIIMNRIDRAITLWLSTKDVGRVSGWASAESSRDAATSDSSYSLNRVLIWAIPIMGFIGTVQGLAVAVAGFGVLGGSADISAIKGAIAQVTNGLGVAFDTTLLALLLVTFLMFPLSFIQRNEENLFVELENFLDDMFIGRLPSPEQQPIVIENLEDSIEAAFRRYIPDPDRYDEVFTRAIEKAATSIEERFSNLTKSYEVTLKEVTGQLANNLAGVSDNLRKSIVESMTEFQKQDSAMLTARRQLSEEENKQFASMLQGVTQSAQSVISTYQKSASELQAASDGAMAKSAQAAQQLAGKMDEVAQLAAGIKDLLNIEKAIEKSVSSIATSEDFRKTLEDLRSHLATTNEFCTRLSKPRVITLREESV